MTALEDNELRAFLMHGFQTEILLLVRLNPSRDPSLPSQTIRMPVGDQMEPQIVLKEGFRSGKHEGESLR